MKYFLWLAMLPLLVGFSRGSELLITEVFFDGTDERVEITNMGSGDFSGTIGIEGAKSSSFSVEINLTAGSTVIIGDKGEHITDSSLYAIRDKGLSITDTKAIVVSIFSGAELLDSFSVDTGDVDTANNEKASFEYIPDSGSIEQTVVLRSTGVLDEYKANPGVVLLADGTPRSFVVASGSVGSGDTQTGGVDTGSGSNATGDIDGGTGDVGTGAVDSGIDIGSGSTGTGSETSSGAETLLYYYDLLITEVFVDGTAEWIEISNIGTGVFSGDFQLRGAKSADLTVNAVQIQPGGSVLVADKADTFIDASSIVLEGAGLSILDTKELYISLLIDNKIVDRLGISEDDVKRFDNQKRSFEKVLYSGTWITTYTTLERKDNIIEGYIANPGTFNIVLEKPEELFFESLLRICPTENTSVSVSEVSYFDNGLPPYIELKTSGLGEEKIIISGSLLAENIELSGADLASNGYLVLARTMSGFAHDTAVYPHDIQRLSGGQLVIYGQSGQVLDNLYIPSLERGVSYYPSTSRQNCILSFDNENQPTPGMSSEVLSYFDFGSDPGPSFGGCAPRPEFIDISIRGIVADPESGDESIILHMNRGPDHKSLDGYYLMIGSRKRYLKGILNYKQTQNIYQNFGFPNDRGECISLHNPEGEILDDICYTKDQAQGLFLDMSQLAGEDEDSIAIEELEPEITIVDIVYDPLGLDTSNEVVYLQNHNALRYDQKDLRLQVGDRNSKTYIYDTLWSNEEKEIVGNFRLPNTKAICVSLMYRQTLLDTFCYDPDEDKDSKQGKTLTERYGGKDTLNNIEIQITDVDYDPEGSDTNNESITFKLLEGTKVDMSNFYLLAGKNKKTLDGILNEKEPLTITKTFGFHNSRITCVTLMHEEKVYDQYCYDPKHTNQKREDTTNANIDLTIDHIDYDPPGKDSEGESITISNHSEEELQMENLTLFINNRKETISGLLPPHSQQIFKEYFRFPNNGACVSLVQGDNIYDTMCYGEEQVSLVQENMSGKLSIDFVDYDPPGNDTNRESISLLRSGSALLDLGDAYLMINDRKKNLEGVLTPGILTTYTENFRFPNDDACVSIYLADEKHDEYCYGAGENKSKQIISLEKILADPYGRDEGKEKLQIHVSEAIQRDKLGLQVNDETKKAERYLVGPYTYEAQGSFGLTNKVGCVSLEYQEIQQDHRCYYSQNEGKRATKKGNQISLASSEQARILNQITVVDESDQYCVSRKGERLSCKQKSAKGSYSVDGSFYRSYISSIHNYLYHNRPTLYYESDIALYRDRYRQADDQLRDGKQDISIDGQIYHTSNFSSIAESQQPTSYYDWLIKKLQSMQNNEI